MVTSLDTSSQLPPVIVLMPLERSPAELFPGARADWRRHSPAGLARGRSELWVEDWAEPLLASDLMPGVVLWHDNTPESNEMLIEVLAESERRGYGQATVVASTTANDVVRNWVIMDEAG